MLTIGQLLKQSRIRKNKTLKNLSKETKIPVSALRALEADEFHRLPCATHIKGFIKNYARVVNLDPEKALAVFRRDFSKVETGGILPRVLSKPFNELPKWKNRFLIGLAIFLASFLFLTYIGWQLSTFFRPPKITVVQPKAGTTLRGPLVEVKGWISADSSVEINGTLAAILPNGSFQANIELLPGKNEIILKARNRRGQISEEKLNVEVLDK